MSKKLIYFSTVLLLGLVGTAKAVEFTATTDIWIRETSPDTTYEDDLLSCWSSASADGGRRYGLFEFDISSLAGESLISATLSLYSSNDWSQATVPIKQYAYNIASGGVTSLTWNTYMSGKDAGKTQLTGLGHYDLGPIDTDPSQQNVYVDSDAATSADLTLLENEASGDGILSLVLIAVEDGTDYRRDWGDIVYLSQPAKLNVIVAGEVGKATNPSPADNAEDVALDADLSWTPGVGTVSHDVYFGTDFNDVNDAADPNTLPGRGRQAVDSNSYDSGSLEEDTTYYWRIDEVNSTTTIKGDVWSFNTVIPSEIKLTATGDIWIREVEPDTTYEDDLVSVWSSYTTGNPDTGYRRYGLIEFDVSSLAGQPLASAKLSLYSTNSGSQATRPIKQYAYNIASGGVTSLTWNTYMLSGKDAGKTQLTGLGHYDLGPINADPSQQDVYVDSDAATSADLTLLENEASGDGILSLVLIAVEDGTDYRRDWGDGYYDTQLAKLVVELLTEKASKPSPADEATDVPRDVTLSWTPGAYSEGQSPQHRIYFGEVFDDVDEGKPGAWLNEQDGESYGPLSLDFGQTYFWRVDEANATTGWGKGDVWQFTVEPIAYILPTESIIDANASSIYRVETTASKTIDGSGLSDDKHSTSIFDMWVSARGGGGAGNPSPSGSTGPAWIAYEFDDVYKLYEMWVWNENENMYTDQGLKNVTIEYSTNGTDWTKLGDYVFDIAPGTAGYAHDHAGPGSNEVEFNVPAKYVVITASDTEGNYGSAWYGLAEVRFYYLPVHARDPQPASGSLVTDPDTVVLSWRGGREAVEHDVYFSDDEQQVIDETALVGTVYAPSSSYDAGSLQSPELGKTYYWKVNEVNTAEDPDTWVGDVWYFTTPPYLVVDNMERYADRVSIETIWRDGYTCVDWGEPPSIPPVTGGCSGSVVDVASGVGGGSQAMAYYYDNDGETFVPGYPTWPYPAPKYSEIEASTSGQNSLEFGTDWSRAKALWLEFYGAPANAAGSTEQMYVKLNNSKVLYDGDMADIQEASWHRWIVDLSSFGINLQNVTKLSIGFGNQGNQTTGGSGIVYFDNIELHPSECVLSKRSADFAKVDYVEDCVVDYREIEIMAGDWLETDDIIATQAPNPAGLLLHWAFDDGFGTTTSDSSANNYIGDVNGATWTSPGYDGTGYCLDFNGFANEVVNNDVNTAINGLSAVTFSVWVNSDLTNTDRGFIICDDPAGDDNRDIRYDTEGSMSDRDDVIKCGITSTEGIHETESSEGVQVVGQWQHVAMMWVAGEPVKLYIDGVLNNTYTNQPARGGTLDGYIKLIVGKGGKDEDPDDGWDGLIDDVRIYNYALPEAEVAWLAAKGASELYVPVPSPAELYSGEDQGERKINLRDHAILANRWLDELFWP